jgi:hypothetical protein
MPPSKPKPSVREGARDQQPALGDIGRTDVAPTANYAWWHELELWVWRFRRDYAHLWADEGNVTNVQRAAGQRVSSYRPGWPRCWHAHRGFVESLVAARALQTGLLRGAGWAGGPKGWTDWDAYLEQSIAPAVRPIRDQCAAEHVDKTWLYRQDYTESHEDLEVRLRSELDLPRPRVSPEQGERELAHAR